jgi:hypothetical protein
VELDIADSDLKAGGPVMAGQQAGTVADFNGDGVQEVALVTKGGDVVILYRDLSRGPKLSLTITLPAGAAGPVNVVGYDGKRCLGARSVSAAVPAFFGKINKGPILLKWRNPGGAEKTKRVILLKSSTVELPVVGR